MKPLSYATLPCRIHLLASISTATEVTKTTTKLSIFQVLFYAPHLNFKLLREFTSFASEQFIAQVLYPYFFKECKKRTAHVQTSKVLRRTHHDTSTRRSKYRKEMP